MLFKKLYYYYLHYKMWSYIVTHLQFDSDELLNDTNYIGRLKKMFIKVHCHKQVYLDCFLCDLYKDTQKGPKCAECPLYKLQHITCLSPNSLFIIVHSRLSKRDKRIKAAEKIRDCVLMKGGLENGI